MTENGCQSERPQNDPLDRLLEVSLSEALGGHGPPDVTEAVLSMLASRLAENNAAQQRLPQPRARADRLAELLPPELPPAPLPVDSPLPAPVPGASARSSGLRWLIGAAVAMCCLVLVYTGFVRLNRPGPGGHVPVIGQKHAINNAGQTMGGEGTQGAQAAAGRQGQPGAAHVAGGSSLSTTSAAAGHAVSGTSDNNMSGGNSSSTKDGARPYQGSVASAASSSGNHAATSSAGVNTSPNSPDRVQPAPATSSDADVIAAIDSAIRQGWLAAGVKPADLASDGEWCRRVYLDIIGRIPTSDELQEFLADRSAQKRRNLVDRLLGSDDYVEEYARNWTNIYTNLLIGRSETVGSELVNREGLRHYLRRSLLKNKPYDELVRDLLTATGSNRPGDADFNGAVNFLLAHSQERATPATAKVAQVFLGVQIQCTQCHNHPVADARQNQFWEFNSFLRQMQPQVVRENGQIVAARLVDVDFLGESGQSPDEAEVYYELRSGLMKVAYPVFIDGTQIPPSGKVAEVHRRRELARLVTESPNLGLAFINRLWAHFLGYGFTRPVDDLGPHNPPSHPQLFNRLAAEFRRHGYDTRQVIRWITLSRPYALSSKIPVRPAPGSRQVVDDPESGQPPLFSRFYLRQMRPEELYESMLAATHVDRTLGEVAYHQTEIAKSQWMQQFTFDLTNDENSEATAFNGTITQTLDLWNGSLVTSAVSAKPGTFLHQVAHSDAREPQKKVQKLFLTALGRQPTANELKMAEELWRRRQGNTVAALQDIWWALLNSNEFILNH